MKFLKKYMLVIFVAFGISMFTEPAFCMLILGFIVLYSSAETIIFLERMKRVGIQTPGTVTFYEKDDEGNITAIVEFTAAGGEVIKDEPYIISLADVEDFTPYNEIAGSQVSVLYHPDDPKRFVIKGKKDWEYITSIFAIIVALAFVVVGVSSLFGLIKFG